MEDADAQPPGVIRLTTDADGDILYVEATRAACMRWGTLLRGVAAEPAERFRTGSEAAESFTGELDASVSPDSPVTLGEFCINDALEPTSSPRPTTWKDRLVSLGCATAVVLMAIVFLRGVVAFVEDVLKW